MTDKHNEEKGAPRGDEETPWENDQQSGEHGSNSAGGADGQGVSGGNGGVGGGDFRDASPNGRGRRAGPHGHYARQQFESSTRRYINEYHYQLPPSKAGGKPREFIKKVKYLNLDEQTGEILKDKKTGKQSKSCYQHHWKPTAFYETGFANPDDKRNWEPKIPEGVEPVLYNLPALLTAPKGSVIPFCEGEKDAEAAIDVFGFGTSTIHGAAYYNKKGEIVGWRESYKDALVGQHVVLFEDNDKPGRVHVQAIGKQLQDVAASIKVVRFRDEKEGYDLWDYVYPGKGETEPKDETDYARLKEELLARAEEWREEYKISMGDFVAYLPEHNYIYMPTRDHWPASSVNSKIPPVIVGVDEDGNPIKIKASAWLDQESSVEQMTWAPGEPVLVRDRLVINGGWIERFGSTCFNSYLPPVIKSGDAKKAWHWIWLIKYLYPNEWKHIINYFAFKAQRPEVKINHALMLGGDPGIGKDTLLEALKQAVGPHNFEEISPSVIGGAFNKWAKCVVLRISEARDLGDISRYDFYESMKTIAATPPDVIRINEKYCGEYYVFNVCGVIVTTNHKTDGLYLPPDDRRHYVAWSNRKQANFRANYWNKFWRWYQNGGLEHVAAYLRELDISGFDPKAPPHKTKAFWDIVNANRAQEVNELSDLFDEMGNPSAVTLDKMRDALASSSDQGLRDWLNDRNNRRKIPHKMEECDYTPVHNDTKDGQWKIGVKRQTIYAKKELSERDRLKAAQDLKREIEEQIKKTQKTQRVPDNDEFET
jgi:hypothetical protein